MEKLSFLDCINSSVGNRHLMLGNGFSISLFPNIFNYSKLKEAVNAKGLQQLFDSFNTNDYEFVLRKILDAQYVISSLKKDNVVTLDYLSQIYSELSATLIETLAGSHPENPSNITEEQYESCRQFLQLFKDGKIYSFNYDLLLYWVFMHFKDSLDSNKILKCDDGFRSSTDGDDSIVWEIGAEHDQKIYYIHGALHIFSNNHIIEKCVWKNKNQPIIEQVRKNLDSGMLPIFVAEGSKDHKKERIHNNGYLARSFASLKNIGGSLYIFGHSIRDEDDHVFDLLLNRNTRLKHIYVGLFGDLDSNYNQAILAKLQSWEDQERSKNPKIQKKIFYYQSSEVNVWGR